MSTVLEGGGSLVSGWVSTLLTVVAAWRGVLEGKTCTGIEAASCLVDEGSSIVAVVPRSNRWAAIERANQGAFG
jgi:hypothetical protein